MKNRRFIYAVAKFRRFVRKHFKDRTTVLVLSVLIGVLGAAAAIIIKNLLHFTTRLLSQAFAVTDINYLYLIFPPIGIFLTLLFVRRVVRDNLSHEVASVVEYFARGRVEQAHDILHQDGLSRTALADDEVGLAVLERGVNVL